MSVTVGSIEDLNRTGFHDEQIQVRIARAKDRLAVLERALNCQPSNDRKITIIQLGKRLRVFLVLRMNRRCCERHGINSPFATFSSEHSRRATQVPGSSAPRD